MKRGIGVIIVATSMSCHGSEVGEAFTHEGEHVVMFAEPGFELCAGSMAYMDEFIKAVSDELGVPAPRGDGRIRYHWLTEEGVEEACRAPVGGCTPGGEVFTQYAPHSHELVHAIASVFGLPRSLFAEGLAVAHEGLGAGPRAHYYLGSADDVLDFVEASQQEFADLGGYRLAGAFTAFLIGQFGMDEYLKAYASIERDADYDRVDHAFQSTFGVSLAENVAAFEGLPSYLGAFCSQTEFDAKLVECSAPEIAWDGRRLALERPLGCEQEDAIGPFDDKVLVLQTITIAVEGRYELRMRGDVQEADSYPGPSPFNRAVTGVSLQRCGGCEDGESMATWDGTTPRVSELRPGLYSLRLHGPAAEGVTLGFTLSLLPEPPEPSGVLVGRP